MLPLKRKTAAELGLDPALYEALVWVRNELAEGKIKHFYGEPSRTDWDMTVRLFNMCRFMYQGRCGSIGCIAGWMSEYLGEKKYFDALDDHNNNYSQSKKQLDPLFYPGGRRCEGFDTWWGDITPAWAVATIDAFLVTGVVDWQANKYAQGESHAAIEA